MGQFVSFEDGETSLIYRGKEKKRCKLKPVKQLLKNGSLLHRSNANRGKKSNRTKDVFLVSAKNAFVPVKRDNSVNTYSRISTVPRGSERSE